MSDKLEGLKPCPESFQARVQPWMMQCFGPEVSADRIERGDRFLEEVFELLQSGGYDPSRIPALVKYVWGRPIGEPSQEVGGVMVTLAAYCLAHGLDMHEAGEVELDRILQPEIVEKIRAKQAAKARDIPFSPLPTVEADRGEVERVARECHRWLYAVVDGHEDCLDWEQLPHRIREVYLGAARHSAALRPSDAVSVEREGGWRDEWPLGSYVRKKKGSQWTGDIVGYYSTELTPEGIAVESSSEIGSVQIYPISAMEHVPSCHQRGEAS